MRRMQMRIMAAVIVFAAISVSSGNAQIDRFMPRQGGTTEVWRITNEPNLRNWANYHNQECWSPDGRYICYTRYEPYDRDSDGDVFIYDLQKQTEIRIDNGLSPRWGKIHNWLFWVKRDAARESTVMWKDIDTGVTQQLCTGVASLGNTDYRDQWLYGMGGGTRGSGRLRTAYRIPIRPESRAELLPGHQGSQWIANPGHPIVFSRDDHGDVNATNQPFEPTRFWCDLDGTNKVIGAPMIQRCHQSWSGDGTWHLFGNSLVAGRKWDEPFPSNLHILSNTQTGDVSPVGKSGRWICGSGNVGPLQIIDLRSGDGYNYLEAALSFIHDDNLFGFSEGSGLHDNDAKGSADGTKICFVSNYDLKNGPMTFVTETAAGTADRINVLSADGFAESGRLTIGNEVVGYARKTPATFEGLTRRLYHTTATNLEYLSPEMQDEYNNRKSDEEFIKRRGLSIFNKLQLLFSKEAPAITAGSRVSSFDHRVIPEDMRKKLPPTSPFLQPDFRGHKDTPLIWQNRTDVFVAVVRKPDRPVLREINGEYELIPGENHWETYGYHLYQDGRKITTEPVRPGTQLPLPGSGNLSAVAVEWSGLESEPGNAVPAAGSRPLRVRVDKPSDFSWTTDRWLVHDKEVPAEQARRAPEAIREIVHLVDGVIHREWYNWGQIVQRYDLNADMKPTRRLSYQNGKLNRREYYTADGVRVSTEYFDKEGYVTESILYRAEDNRQQEYSHYWYDRGTPIRYVGVSVRNSAPLGTGLYEKEGDRWVKKASLEN